MNNQELYILCDGMKVHAKINYPQNKSDHLPLVIIFHGLTGHMEERHIVALKDTALSCHYATLRVELYGHGQSDGQFADHTILHWLTQGMQVINFAKKMNSISDIYLAGHSQGALTAILLAGMMHENIKGLIALSPAVNIAYGAKEIKKKFPDRTQLKPSYFQAARIIPLEKAISLYHGPILLVHGTNDQTVPFSYASDLAQKQKSMSDDFTFQIIKGADHCYRNKENLEKVMNTVSDFLIKHNQ